MMDAPHDAPNPDPAEEAGATPAPRRRRSAPAAGQPADAPPSATAEAAAPKRRSRRPAAGEDASAVAPAEPPAEAAPAPDAGESPAAARAPRRRAAPRPAPAAEASQASAEPEPSEAPPADEPAAAAAPSAAEAVLPEAVAEGGGPVESGESGPRRPMQVPPPAESLMASRALFDDLVGGAYDPEAVAAAQAAAGAPAEDGSDEASDADGEGADSAPARRVLEPEADAPKLHKVLAQSGVGSRRDMEQWIADGKVTVNGEVAHLGMRVVAGDRVEVNGKPVRLRIHPPSARVLAYHKPTGEVVTHQDPEGRPTVFRHLPRLPQGKWLSVGRLDINTEGLLLFTNSGDLANRLMHPRFGVEREYAVRVLGQLDETQRAQLLAGVEIEGLPAAFRSIEDGGGEGANRWYRVVIAEGRNREVRKLFESVGLVVSRLIRIRYGSVVLPRGLKRGVWVELDEPDLKVIRRLAGLADGPRPAPAGKAAKPPRGAKPGAPLRGEDGGRPFKGGKPGGPAPQPARGPKPARPPRAERPPREALRDADGELLIDDIGRIPNPLEQTFDRRFAKGGPRRPAQGFGGARPHDEDGGLPAGGIPNPLEQTFDRRFVKGSQRIVAGFGRPDTDDSPRPQAKGKGPKQPDPMQTSVGYIGADAYFNKGKKGGGGGGGGSWGGKRRGR